MIRSVDKRKFSISKTSFNGNLQYRLKKDLTLCYVKFYVYSVCRYCLHYTFRILQTNHSIEHNIEDHQKIKGILDSLLLPAITEIRFEPLSTKCFSWFLEHFIDSSLFKAPRSRDSIEFSLTSRVVRFWNHPK